MQSNWTLKSVIFHECHPFGTFFTTHRHRHRYILWYGCGHKRTICGLTTLSSIIIQGSRTCRLLFYRSIQFFIHYVIKFDMKLIEYNIGVHVISYLMLSKWLFYKYYTMYLAIFQPYSDRVGAHIHHEPQSTTQSYLDNFHLVTYGGTFLPTIDFNSCLFDVYISALIEHSPPIYMHICIILST